MRLLLCAAALACTSALAQPAPPVYRLTVEAPDKELRELLQRGLQLARWQDDAQMTPQLLERLAEEALVEARGALAARGFFSADLRYSIDRGPTPWVVVLRVEPGARTRVRSVDISFTGPGASDPAAERQRRQVEREWLLSPGLPFTQAGWTEAKREALRRMSSWRYAGASIASSRARVDPQTQSAALELTLDSGPPYVFGEVEVRGARRYADEVAANLSPVRPGVTYDREVLELYTQRLLASGYFAGGRVELAPEARAEAAPVRATVIEGNSQNFEGGVSYNTDSGLRLELAHRNVDLFDAAWRGRSQLRLDQLTQEARYDLDSPPRPGARWWSGFGSVKNSLIQNEETLEVAAGIAHNWAGKGSPTSLLVSFHQEEQSVSGVEVDDRDAVFFGVRVGVRDTDHLVSPRRGYFGLLTAGFAPDALSTRGFQRVTARGTVLFPLARNDDLALRAEGGVVFARSREGIPASFLFRTGGDQTVRGYDFESIGVPVGDAVLGGRYLAVASVEYTHWFSPDWGLALFVDAGDAWDTGSFNPKGGYGTGGRFRTPIGPVRVDVAYGEENKSWRLHFSVGFVF